MQHIKLSNIHIIRAQKEKRKWGLEKMIAENIPNMVGENTYI